MSDEDEVVEDPEARRERLAKSFRGALAALLTLEAIVVLLVPRAIAQTDVGLGGLKTGLLLGLAAAMVLTGFLLRRPWGIALGSLLQVLAIATGLWTAAMFVLAGIFAGCWFYMLNFRSELLGTPGGWRIILG